MKEKKINAVTLTATHAHKNTYFLYYLNLVVFDGGKKGGNIVLCQLLNQQIIFISRIPVDKNTVCEH